jgi:hypothetical protein
MRAVLDISMYILSQNCYNAYLLTTNCKYKHVGY